MDNSDSDVISGSMDSTFLDNLLNVTEDEAKENEDTSRIDILNEDVKTSSIILEILQKNYDVLGDIDTIMTPNSDVEILARKKAREIIFSIINLIDSSTF